MIYQDSCFTPFWMTVNTGDSTSDISLSLRTKNAQVGETANLGIVRSFDAASAATDLVDEGLGSDESRIAGVTRRAIGDDAPGDATSR